tara:strand:- start:71 stop:433 length:363 start_codon:yes stop_codon:yes gene_type:complete
LGSIKLLFIEWILEVLRSVSIYFLNKKARMEANNYAIENDSLDMRTVPPLVKRNIIHNQEILDNRWNLCSSCEFLTESNKCKKCGCFMKVKHKLAFARCPIGKWEKYTDEKELSGTYLTS